MKKTDQEILAIATDLDGTLLFDHNDISPRNYSALKKAHEMDIKLIIASGRTSPSIQNACKTIDFPYSIISYNGAKLLEFKDENWNTVFSASLADEAVSSIFKLCQERKILLNVYTDDVLYGYQADGDFKWGDMYTKQTKTPYFKWHTNLKDLPTRNITKLLTICTFEKRDKLYDDIYHDLSGHCSMVKSNPEFLEYLPLNISKGTTLQKWCSYHNIEAERVAAMGDAENDLEMLQTAGIGIASHDATVGLKKAWNRVSQWSSEEDFVGRELELILNLQ